MITLGGGLRVADEELSTCLGAARLAWAKGEITVSPTWRAVAVKPELLVTGNRAMGMTL
jgi:hypothetical protein